MNEHKAYAITTTERLRQLCREKRWLSEGTKSQHDALFVLNEVSGNVPASILAGIIWICSDRNKASLYDIAYTLTEEAIAYREECIGKAKEKLLELHSSKEETRNEAHTEEENNDDDTRRTE